MSDGLLASVPSDAAEFKHCGWPTGNAFTKPRPLCAGAPVKAGIGGSVVVVTGATVVVVTGGVVVVVVGGRVVVVTGGTVVGGGVPLVSSTSSTNEVS